MFGALTGDASALSAVKALWSRDAKSVLIGQARDHLFVFEGYIIISFIPYYLEYIEIDQKSSSTMSKSAGSPTEKDTAFCIICDE